MSHALIGEILIDKGYISPAELELGLAHQSATGKRLGESLVELGLITVDQLNDALGEKFSIPVVDLTPDMLSDELWNSIPRSFIIEYGIIPIFRDGNTLHVVTSDPTSLDFKEKLERAVGCRVEVSLADATVIHNLITQWLSGTEKSSDIADASIFGGLGKAVNAGAVEIVVLTGTLSSGTYFRTGRQFRPIDIPPIQLERWCRTRSRLPDDYSGHAWTVFRAGDLLIPAQMTFCPVQEGTRLSIRLGREMLQKQPFVLPDLSDLKRRVEAGGWVVLCGCDPWLMKLAVDLLPDDPPDPAGWLALVAPGVPVPGEIPLISFSGNSIDAWNYPDLYTAMGVGSGLLVSTPAMVESAVLDALVQLHHRGKGIVLTWPSPGPYAFMAAMKGRMVRDLTLVSISRLRRLCRQCRRPADPEELRRLHGSLHDKNIRTNVGCRQCRGGTRGIFSFVEILRYNQGSWFTESGTPYPSAGANDWFEFPEGTTPVMCAERASDIPLWDLLMIQSGWMITGSKGDETHATR